MLRALLVIAAVLGQTDGPLTVAPCQARLQLTNEHGSLVLTGSCTSLLDQPASYRYTLHTERLGPGGRSANTQAGRFSLAPHEQVTLSSIHFNQNSQDYYQARLIIFDANGRSLAQDSVSRRSL